LEQFAQFLHAPQAAQPLAAVCDHTPANPPVSARVLGIIGRALGAACARGELAYRRIEYATMTHGQYGRCRSTRVQVHVGFAATSSNARFQISHAPQQANPLVDVHSD
jgi:hypothetical protein